VVDISEEQVASLKRAVGERARALRERAGLLKASQAADQLGLKSDSALYDLEKGRNFVGPEMLLKLAALYGVSPAEFFPGEKPAEDASGPSPDRADLLAMIRNADESQLAMLLAVVKAIVAPESRKDAKPRRA
jgi:transcriptional regulator with XRE-family HTH domain